jgi:hypothetical protein
MQKRREGSRGDGVECDWKEREKKKTAPPEERGKTDEWSHRGECVCV